MAASQVSRTALYPLRQKSGSAAECGDESVDFRRTVVCCKADSDRSLDSESLHEWLGAMVTSAYFDPLLVKEHADIVVMRSGKVE